MAAQVVDGALMGALAGEQLPVEDPSTGRVLYSVPLGRPEDARAAIAAARRAFDDGPWPHMSPAERGATLRRLGELISAHEDRFAEIGENEVGTPRRHARGLHAARPFDAWNDLIERGSRSLEAELPRIDGPPSTRQVITREPRGVVALITPWNAPHLTNLWKVAAALVTGNTVVLKPSPEAPSAALELGRLALSAGIPRGVLNVVTGGADVGEVLVSHPDVDMVSFTGSPEVGRLIAAAGAGTLKRLALELGGKSAQLVLPDADPGAVVARAMRIVLNAGQVCAAETRLLLPEQLHDDIVGRLVALLTKVRVGSAHDDSTEMGPLISRAHRERVERWIEVGRNEGAKVASGGGRPTGVDPDGHYVEPTLLTDVTNDMTVAREEIFGPVLCVIRYSGAIDDGLAIANDSPYGLVGSVWTRDTDLGLQVARRIRAGRVSVNAVASSDDGPFGGFKQSGLGRELGQLGLEEFTEVRHLSWTDPQT